MTDWLRVLGAYFVDYLPWVIFVLGLLFVAVWEIRSRFKLKTFRQKAITHVQDSQRGRRPMWIQESGKDKDR